MFIYLSLFYVCHFDFQKFTDMREMRWYIILGVFTVISFFACSSSNNLQIIISADASELEVITATDLMEDIQSVLDVPVEIVREGSESSGAKQILLGTSSSNELVADILENADVVLTSESPGSRGGLWHRVNKNKIVIAGSDIQGLQYAVYDFSKMVLDIDPLIYWTGHIVETIDIKKIFSTKDKVLAPPVVPLLVYFDNDADELMNLKDPLLTYDWESYTEMIDALVRMRYNGISLFDALGRPEFYLRESYKQIVPDYQLDIDYVDRMIDYAHLKGMKVQIDMSMGYQIKSLEESYGGCWTKYKDKWIEVWKYYLNETPIGKADIYTLRPRNQIWDWEYKSSCGESKSEVFNEVYATLGSIIDQHNADAIKVTICYSDGMEMFNDGFRPPSDWIVAWSDDGYAEFEVLPEDTDGLQFGTYMHAGFWKNHTVSHPYPHTIDTSMSLMFDTYNATAYCMVNGQQFRPFILNIEAFSEVCRDPTAYSGDRFYEEWLKRYFPDTLHEKVLEVMKGWDACSFGKAGYVENLWEIKEAIAFLSDTPIQSPGKKAKPSSAARVEGNRKDTRERYKMFQYYAHLCSEINPVLALSSVRKSAHFHDQIGFPIQIYIELLGFQGILHEIYRMKIKYKDTPHPNLKKQAKALLKRANERLEKIVASTKSDSKDPKWEGWYDLSKRRPNNGFPTAEMLKTIEVAIDENW